MLKCGILQDHGSCFLNTDKVSKVMLFQKGLFHILHNWTWTKAQTPMSPAVSGIVYHADNH